MRMGGPAARARWRMDRRLTLGTALLAILPACRHPGQPGIEGSHSLRVAWSALNESREVFVHLPIGYDGAEQRYPVLLVLDAEEVFRFAVGTVDFLAPSRMPEMIVVGIPNTNRERDLWVDPGNLDGAHVHFTRFLEQDLVPVIDARYRTQPYRVLYGFCSGASTVFWLLFRNSGLFEGCIASGTGFDESWAELARQGFKSAPALEKALFAVTEGTTPRARGMPLLRTLLETSAPPGLSWECCVMENEEHGPVAALGLFAGLRWIFSDWRLPQEVAIQGPAAVRRHFRELSRRYGFEVGLPADSIMSAAQALLWQGNTTRAIEILLLVVGQRGESPDAWDLLGQACEDDEQFAKARDAYQNAVRIAEEIADRRLPVFEERLRGIRRRLRDSQGEGGSSL